MTRIKLLLFAARNGNIKVKKSECPFLSHLNSGHSDSYASPNVLSINLIILIRGFNFKGDTSTIRSKHQLKLKTLRQIFQLLHHKYHHLHQM